MMMNNMNALPLRGCQHLSHRLETPLGGFVAGGRRMPPPTERLWHGELRRSARHFNIITFGARRHLRGHWRLAGVTDPARAVHLRHGPLNLDARRTVTGCPEGGAYMSRPAAPERSTRLLCYTLYVCNCGLIASQGDGADPRVLLFRVNILPLAIRLADQMIPRRLKR
jgi:hypothetical protein